VLQIQQTMKKQVRPYQKFIFLGITIIALGITLSTNLADSAGSFGIVLIAVGGLFFIVGMNKKRQEDDLSNS
jgi:predicted membrane channel-forming protein YqfA (hemolysin III family)